MILATPREVPSDAAGWSAWIDRTGVAISILIVTGAVLYRLARWMRPKVDSVIDAVLANNARVPVLMEAQARRDQEIVQALEKQSELLARLCGLIERQEPK